jgi:hypothetical protein
VRANALELVRFVKPFDERLWLLILAATRDADEVIRKRAARLQSECPPLGAPQVVALAGRVGEDISAGVRLDLVNHLKPHLRQAEVREPLSRALKDAQAVLTDEEFGALAELLAPYAPRDPNVKSSFEALAAAGLPPERRKKIESLGVR